MTTAERLRAEGLAKGRAEGQAQLFLSLLTTRFGSLGTEHREAVQNATPEQIQLWSTRFAEGAGSLGDVFG